MHEPPMTTEPVAEGRFWSMSRTKLVFVCVAVVWASAILSHIGLVFTKDIELHPQELFLYIFMGTPVLVAMYAGVKERGHPFRVTLIVSLSWSVISFLITWATTETAVVMQHGVILAFVQEGILYAAFLVFVAFVAHKVAVLSNTSVEPTA